MSKTYLLKEERCALGRGIKSRWLGVVMQVCSHSTREERQKDDGREWGTGKVAQW